MKKHWRIVYNSPVILTFTLLSLIVVVLGYLTNGIITREFFTLYPNFSIFNIPRMFTYILGHANFAHFFGNFSIILLVGPLIEEKYGSKNLLIMILLTAFVTALIQIILFNNGVLGASGIVFMLILLSPFTNTKEKEIPLTFILIFVIYLGQEVLNALTIDNVSQFGHIMGGIIGAFFGHFFKPTDRMI